MRINCLPALEPASAGWQVGGAVSGYKMPEVLGVLACGTALARPRRGYSRGCSRLSVAGTEALEFVV